MDTFLFDVSEKTLDFLNGWVGVSQRQVERFLKIFFIVFVAATTIIMFATNDKIHMLPFFRVLNGMILMPSILYVSSLSSQIRTLRRIEGRRNRYIGWGVIVWYAVMGHLTGPNPVIVNLYLYSCLFDCFLKLVHEYVACSKVDGEKGKKAAMAWDKVKELFGTQWIPQPVGVK